MKALLLLPLTFTFCLSTQAQSLQDIMNKALKQQGEQGQTGGEKQGGDATVTIEENTDAFTPLDFTGSYRMEVHSYTNGKEEKDSPNQVRMSFTSDRMAMSPQVKDSKEEMRMVFDLRNKLTYTLMTDDKGERTGMKMKMMKVKVDGQEKEGKDLSTVTRTDETKVIEGHTCRKYTYRDEEGAGEAWIAEDLSFDMMAAFRQMVGGTKVDNWQKMATSGVVMENTWTSANGKEKVVMYTKDLVVGKVDESAFSTAGYEIMDMTSFPTMGR